jgi:hypothetical protein
MPKILQDHANVKMGILTIKIMEIYAANVVLDVWHVVEQRIIVLLVIQISIELNKDQINVYVKMVITLREISVKNAT